MDTYAVSNLLLQRTMLQWITSYIYHFVLLWVYLQDNFREVEKLGQRAHAFGIWIDNVEMYQITLPRATQEGACFPSSSPTLGVHWWLLGREVTCSGFHFNKIPRAALYSMAQRQELNSGRLGSLGCPAESLKGQTPRPAPFPGPHPDSLTCSIQLEAGDNTGLVARVSWDAEEGEWGMTVRSCQRQTLGTWVKVGN